MSFDWGSAPQWITAGIAGGALWAANKSINSQREIARKRAAMDFFVKTEMDQDTLKSHKRFNDAVDKLISHLASGDPCAGFVATPEYWHIRDYLNLHELMAVGLNTQVYDDDVCFAFWSRELEQAYEKTLPLIQHIQNMPDEKDTYTELVKVTEGWLKKDADRKRVDGI
jgi:hypothetical protein